ncbi:siderophore-interacting protein [Marinomonas arenicola]|uniref:siderophore-interacting protein n=1 Tax=Marinomonas arenicola TaxID=569601 RepID=UPI00311ED7DC
MTSLTPISDIDHKIDIIDHVNQDHTEELLAIAKSRQARLPDASSEQITAAKIRDIFQQGMEIEANFSNGTTSQLFVPFEIDGDLEDKILYLAYASIAKQGRDFSGAGKQFFEIISKQAVTPNILRLTIKSAAPLPDYYPGYAYAFLLKTLKKRPTSRQQETQKKPWHKTLFDRAFISLIKHLSSKSRQKLLQQANKDVRLYTLRKSWRSSETASFSDQGFIDIFTHGNTPGSQWANTLAPGDIIMSRSAAKDKHPHLAHGQAVLIADETAYPALAGILEQWQNPTPPYVIVISAKAEEQAYFNNLSHPEGTHFQPLICPAIQQAESTLNILKTLTNIDVAWAALEAESAKKIRHYLRNERQISGKNNHTKAYWKLKK